MSELCPKCNEGLKEFKQRMIDRRVAVQEPTDPYYNTWSDEVTKRSIDAQDNDMNKEPF